jgi:hypothetical protein
MPEIFASLIICLSAIYVGWGGKSGGDRCDKAADGEKSSNFAFHFTPLSQLRM